MDNSSINPVTEAEVRTVAERLVTTFVSLSNQSKELAELQIRFSSLEYRVTNLSEANERLKSQVDILVSERDAARKEVQEVTSLLKVAEDEREKAKEEVRRWSGDYDRVKAQKERVDDEYQRLYESYQQSQRELVEARRQRDDNAHNLQSTQAELALAIKANEVANSRIARVTAALAVVEDAKAEASEEARADITRIPVASEPQAVEAPKPEEEPWWKSQQARQW